MITPQHFIDGALVATGTVLAVSVDPSIVTAIAGAATAGVFIVLAKVVELLIRSYLDKRVGELESRAEKAEGDVIRLLEVVQELKVAAAVKANS